MSDEDDDFCFKLLREVKYVYFIIYHNKTGIAVYDIDNVKRENTKTALFDSLETLFGYARINNIKIIYIKQK